MINEIIEGNLTLANDIFKNKLHDKIDCKLQEMKVSVGKSMFKEKSADSIPQHPQEIMYFDKKSLKQKKINPNAFVVKRSEPVNTELKDLDHVHIPHHPHRHH